MGSELTGPVAHRVASHSSKMASDHRPKQPNSPVRNRLSASVSSVWVYRPSGPPVSTTDGLILSIVQGVDGLQEWDPRNQR